MLKSRPHKLTGVEETIIDLNTPQGWEAFKTAAKLSTKDSMTKRKMVSSIPKIMKLAKRGLAAEVMAEAIIAEFAAWTSARPRGSRRRMP